MNSKRVQFLHIAPLMVYLLNKKKIANIHSFTFKINIILLSQTPLFVHSLCKHRVLIKVFKEDETPSVEDSNQICLYLVTQ